MGATIRATLAAALLALTALSGCGDDQVKADNAYVTATDRVVRTFETRFQAQQSRFTPVSTPAQDVGTLATLRASVDRAVTDLARIHPPGRITTLHARLVAQVRQYGTVIQDAKAGFASTNPRSVIAARQKFSRALASIASRITVTITTINRKLR